MHYSQRIDEMLDTEFYFTTIEKQKDTTAPTFKAHDDATIKTIAEEVPCNIDRVRPYLNKRIQNFLAKLRTEASASKMADPGVMTELKGLQTKDTTAFLDKYQDDLAHISSAADPIQKIRLLSTIRDDLDNIAQPAIDLLVEDITQGYFEHWQNDQLKVRFMCHTQEALEKSATCLQRFSQSEARAYELSGIAEEFQDRGPETLQKIGEAASAWQRVAKQLKTGLKKLERLNPDLEADRGEDEIGR